MATTLKSMNEFLDEMNITMKSVSVPKNPYGDDPQWDPQASHWLCTFTNADGATFDTYFSMGSAYTEEPTAEQVMDCLSSDAESIQYAGFEEWAREMGYDEDSRRAERTYNLIEQQARELKAFLGLAAYDELLYRVERE